VKEIKLVKSCCVVDCHNVCINFLVKWKDVKDGLSVRIGCPMKALGFVVSTLLLEEKVTFVLSKLGTFSHMAYGHHPAKHACLGMKTSQFRVTDRSKVVIF